ncbi:MAG: hypothetical protein QM769_11045 [Pseudoxanthomonas sp.]
MRVFVSLLSILVVLSGCATVPAERVFAVRMYNLSTGEVVNGVARTNRAGQSVLSAGPTATGETFNGEATSIDNRLYTSSRGSGTIRTQGVFSNSYISTSSYSTSTPGYQNGSAILVGNQGTVIDILYRAAISGACEGEGRDNKGVNYRISCAQQR